RAPWLPAPPPPARAGPAPRGRCRGTPAGRRPHGSTGRTRRPAAAGAPSPGCRPRRPVPSTGTRTPSTCATARPRRRGGAGPLPSPRATACPSRCPCPGTPWPSPCSRPRRRGPRRPRATGRSCPRRSGRRSPATDRSRHQPPFEVVGGGGGDADPGERPLPEGVAGVGHVDELVGPGSRGRLARLLAGRAFDQHLQLGADLVPVALQGDPLLGHQEAVEALLDDGLGDLVGPDAGGGAGP